MAWSRLARRLFRPFLTREEKRRIAAAIAEAEKRTDGSIHVHVIARMGKHEPLELAKETFRALGLHRTSGRHGVLILISHLDHRFAIWGDEGIHSKSGQHLWDRAAQALRARFAERRYAEGVEACVREIGQELSRHFPKPS
jgi:uncharacterized membrane protein